MRFSAAFFIFLILCSCTTSPQARKTGTALDALRKARATTTWNATSAKVADFDCDGKADAVVLGSEKGQAVVGVVWGAIKPIQVFVFPIRRDRPNGFCAAPSQIEITPLACETDEGTLPGCKVQKGCQAFLLIDGECDPFNFYWNSDQQQLDWWRM